MCLGQCLHLLANAFFLLFLTAASEYCSASFQHANEDVEKMILGNKCDMDDRRVVSKERGDQVCSRLYCDHFVHGDSVSDFWRSGPSYYLLICRERAVPKWNAAHNKCCIRHCPRSRVMFIPRSSKQHGSFQSSCGNSDTEILFSFTSKKLQPPLNKLLPSNQGSIRKNWQVLQHFFI